MSDELESLSDSELDAVFAEVVAGWTYHQSKHGHFYVKSPGPDGVTTEPDFGGPAYNPVTGVKLFRRWTDRLELPAYSTDANAVLPWLQKAEWACDFYGEKHLVSLHRHFASGSPSGEADTFAKAACIALIRAKRAQQPSP